MIDLTITPKLVISVICSNVLFQTNSFILIVGFLLLVALLILYFLVIKYKTRSVFQEDDKEDKIRVLQEMISSKDKEIYHLESKLKKGEIKWKDWDDEKEKLNRRIKSMENKIEQYKMKHNTEKTDLIIEYYMTKND